MLTRAILGEGCKSVAAGMNPMDLRRGINLAVEHVVDDLKRRAKMISTTGEIAQARALLLTRADCWACASMLFAVSLHAQHMQAHHCAEHMLCTTLVGYLGSSADSRAAHPR